jgi:3-hydroxybutyryl-CoA dehydrogenase
VNYPGGPLRWLDNWPASDVLAVLDALDTTYRGERYRASLWLRRRAAVADWQQDSASHAC